MSHTGSTPIGSTCSLLLMQKSPAPEAIVMVPAGRPLAKTRNVVPSATAASMPTSRCCSQPRARTSTRPLASIATPAAVGESETVFRATILSPASALAYSGFLTPGAQSNGSAAAEARAGAARGVPAGPPPAAGNPAHGAFAAGAAVLVSASATPVRIDRHAELPHRRGRTRARAEPGEGLRR